MPSIINDLRKFNKNGRDSWVLPPWNHPISEKVFPLCIVKDDVAIPIGTAFMVSEIGILISATHNILEMFRHHRRREMPRDLTKFETDYNFDDVSLSIIHQIPNEDGTTRITLLPIENVHVARPTDVVYGSLIYQTLVRYRGLALSPSMPRIDSGSVLSVGYCDFKYPEDGISLKSIREGSFDWANDYSHTLRVCEGQIKAIFVQKFASGFIEGPCLITDFEIEHGQSGGPAFNEHGFIFGVNSAGSTKMLDFPSSILSLLYPTLGTNIKKILSLMENCTLNFTVPVIQLIQNGAIKTDSSEFLNSIEVEDDGFRVSPIGHGTNLNHVFDDVHGFINKSPAIAHKIKELLESYTKVASDN